MSKGSGGLEIGSVIGQKYLLTRVIGRGGMGTVFEATHGLSAERVAVKGAPIRWKALTPTFGRPNAIGMARRAQHPHAALLFTDFLLSREGHTILKDHNPVTASQAVNSPLNDFPFEMIDPTITLDEDQKWSKIWSDLFLKGQRVVREVD